MSFRNFECTDGVSAEIFLATVTGTHSAGKSTLVESFTNTDFTNLHSITP